MRTMRSVTTNGHSRNPSPVRSGRHSTKQTTRTYVVRGARPRALRSKPRSSASLELASSDDSTATITVTINDASDYYGKQGISFVIVAVNDQFDAANIPQEPVFSFCTASNPSAVYALEDMCHSWNMLGGCMDDDESTVP